MKILHTSVISMAFFFGLFLVLSNITVSADNPPPKDIRKLIGTVDAAASTIVLNDQKNNLTHTYRVDDMTTLVINGVPGKFGEIKSGMEVRDMVERDNDTLDSLTLIGYGDETKK